VEIAASMITFLDADVTVASFYDDTAPDDSDVPVVPLRADSRFDSTAYYRLLRLLRREDIDILHTHDNFLGSVGRVLGTVAGVGIVNTEHRQHDSLTPLQNAVNIPTIALADRVVTNSNATKQSFLKAERLLLDPNQLEVVYNGVDLQRLNSVISVVQNDTDSIQIITVGRLVDIKNQAVLLMAFKRVVESIPDVQLCIVGTGPLREELEARAKALGIREHMQFLGELPREDVYRRLAESDLFVMPSTSEGFCVAAVEAMAVGLPVVVSDIDVFHEVVGDIGIFADPNNPAEFADAIVDLLKHPEKHERLGRRCKERVRSIFSIEKTARKYYKIYKLVSEISGQ
jgi:glycosyltransferase involved in cell wall biosynthesis